MPKDKLNEVEHFLQVRATTTSIAVETDVLDLGSTNGPTRAKASGSKGFSWEEVAKHNKKGDAWVVYRGFVYDVTSWVDRHPGGTEQILLCAGRDVTDLVAMYHPFSMEKVDKYFAGWEKLGPCTESEFPVFKEDSGFYKELSDDVAAYFEKHKLDPKDWRYGAWRMVPVALTMAWAYCTMNGIGPFATDSWAVLVLAALAFGWSQAMPLLHVMHDSCHTAFGRSQSLWQWAGRVPMDWIAGSSILSWQHQHVVGHHVYTNLFEADPDLPQTDGDARRLVDRQAWGWVYRWQWIYLPLLYSILGMKMRYDDIFEVYLKQRDGPIRVNWFDSPIWRVWVTKAVWATWRIALPLAVLGVDPARYWTLFAIAEATTGWYLALNFQVSHVSVDAEFPLNQEPVEDPKAKKIAVEWAENQVRTSVNYVGGAIPDYMCGALNYQIEHHLFPGVSQYHYPAIAPIVKEHCERKGLPYNCRSGFLDALGAHLSYLYKMGQEEKPVGLH